MSICRGCLVNDADVFHSLFSKIETIPVVDMYQSLTGLAVSREDTLPRYICNECCEGLLQFYKLRTTMIQSATDLRAAIVLAVATSEEYATFEPRKSGSATTEPSVSMLSEQLKVEHNSEVEIYSDGSVQTTASGQDEPQTITESIEIERLGKGETASLLLDSSQLEVLHESPEKADFDDVDDENRSEYLASDLDEASQSEPDANNAVVKEATIAAVGSRVYCCGCPNLLFHNRDDLARHTREVHAKERVYNNVRPYECEICFKRYLHYSSLEQHQTLPYREKKFVCPEPGCGSRFFGRSALQSHTKTQHLRVRTYVCDLCEKAFYTSSTLLSHRKIHTEKQYQCTTCRKMFLRQGDLLTHQTMHLDERPFSCEQCDKRFKCRNHLRTHQYVHSQERRFKCDICDATFTTYNDRRVHILGHYDIHPYKCSYCDKVFKRNFKLQGHIRKVHTGERPFACSQCPQKFYVNWQLTAHLRKSHDVAGAQKHTAEASKMTEDEDEKLTES